MLRALAPSREFPTVTRAAQHVWLAVAFVFVWLHFSYVQRELRHQDWQLYTLYFVAVSGVAARYVTGIRHGRERWHRVVFDGLSILFIAMGVNLTGRVHSDLWLVYLIFVIAETLAASARGFLITDGVAVISYVVATWPKQLTQDYSEMLVTRIFFMVLVASIARTIAFDERTRQEDLAVLREDLSISEERRRLSRDIHDGVGHVLTRVILSLEMARRTCANDAPAACDAMAQQAAALRSAMEEMRQIVATLRTDTSAVDLRTAIRTAAALVEQSAAMAVEVRVPEAPLPLSAHRQYHLSRVIQEALTNCLKHSEATSITVEVSVLEPAVGAPTVTARVTDNGCGFHPERVRAQDGNGLRGMEERLTAFEGRLEVRSSPGQGTTIIAELPGDQDD
ncbi:MAG: Sensor histidine kinase [Armatimonadetes bacterium]|jgi:signal transduction histidine kinase|nr:Sensor histidine kinase [Armatimonadota bacterium]